MLWLVFLTGCVCSCYLSKVLLILVLSKTEMALKENRMHVLSLLPVLCCIFLKMISPLIPYKTESAKKRKRWHFLSLFPLVTVTILVRKHNHHWFHWKRNSIEEKQFHNIVSYHVCSFYCSRLKMKSLYIHYIGPYFISNSISHENSWKLHATR